MRFGSRGPSEEVFRPFASDTSPKWIDQEGLAKRHTGIRQHPDETARLGLTTITFNLLIWTAVLSLFVSLFLFFTVSDLTLKAAKFRECTVKSL